MMSSNKPLADLLLCLAQTMGKGKGGRSGLCQWETAGFRCPREWDSHTVKMAPRDAAPGGAEDVDR